MSKVTSVNPVRWLALLVCMPAWAAHYSVIEIPAPLTQAAALNDNGDIVGSGITDTPPGVFLYQHSSRGVSQLPCVAGTPCTAGVAAINDHGTAVGGQSNPGVGPQAVQWVLNGGAEYVNHVVGNSSDATGIANNGDVIGALLSERRTAGFLWKTDGSGVFLGDLNPVQCEECVFAPHGSAAAINDRGHIVGWADWAVATTPDPSGPFVRGVHAFLWRNGEIADLGALGDGTYSSANGLNNTGGIVGVTSVGTVNTAFLYAKGRMRNLGNLGHQADLNSDANGIDDRGEIVGWSDVRLAANDAVVQRAFLYSLGHMRDLNTLIDHRSASSGRVKLTNAMAINCNGWIAANGYDVRSGKVHAYLLKPRGAERRECRHRRS